MLNAFSAWEVIGLDLPNPRGVTRIPIPPDLTREQLAELEAWIEAVNREAEMSFALEMEAARRAEQEEQESHE